MVLAQVHCQVLVLPRFPLLALVLVLVLVHHPSPSLTRVHLREWLIQLLRVVALETKNK